MPKNSNGCFCKHCHIKLAVSEPVGILSGENFSKVFKKEPEPKGSTVTLHAKKEEYVCLEAYLSSKGVKKYTLNLTKPQLGLYNVFNIEVQA